MKNFVVLFVISGYFASTMHGQVGFMDSTYTWTEVYYFPLGHQSFRNTMSPDPTYYNGKTYYQILYSLDEEGGAWQNSWEFLRYEDQKLYQGWASDEVLIFDYSLDVNDTLYTGPVYVVTGIDSVTLANGEKRKRLHTQCPFGEWGDWTIYWIEGMPSSAGIRDHHSFCAADAGSALLCIWNNIALLYSNPDLDSCWLVPVATFEIDQTNVEILGNPVESWLNISDPDQEVLEVNVYDFFGRMLYRGEKQSINMENTPEGFYMVAIKLKSGHIMVHKILRM